MRAGRVRLPRQLPRGGLPPHQRPVPGQARDVHSGAYAKGVRLRRWVCPYYLETIVNIGVRFLLYPDRGGVWFIGVGVLQRTRPALLIPRSS